MIAKPRAGLVSVTPVCVCVCALLMGVLGFNFSDVEIDLSPISNGFCAEMEVGAKTCSIGQWYVLSRNVRQRQFCS